MPTFGELGTGWLEQKRAAGSRAVRTEGSRWRMHFADTPLAPMRVDQIRRADVRAWLAWMLGRTTNRGKPYAFASLRQALSMLHQILDVAVDEDYLESNPAQGVRLPRSRAARTEEPWTVLTPVEQTALLNAVPLPHRHVVLFALGTGMRQSEQWCLRLVDVHSEEEDPFVDVRFGRDNKPVKSGKPRRIPLFARGLEAFVKWRACDGAARTSISNELGLVFPGPRGGRRKPGPPYAWNDWLRDAGITRRVRWHDLRHTCAASLVSGWWGRAWSLEEVKELLGHQSITMTQRYAHFAIDLLARAARETDEAARKGI